jgi:sulfonate transport system substrate-binding protein
MDLKTKVFGITKFGGGAHINTVLISSQQGWKEDVDFKIKSLGHLGSLIAGLRSGALVWEPFSIKSLIDITGDIKSIGDVIPPWPCFMVAERTSFLQDKKYSDQIKGLLSSFQEAAMIFHQYKAYSIEIISKNYKLSQEDSKRWFESVKYSVTGKISHKALQEVVTTLLKTGTISHRIDVANLTT